MEISENSDFGGLKKTRDLNGFKRLTNFDLNFIDEACDKVEQEEQRIFIIFD